MMEVGNASEATLDVVTATYQKGRTPPLRIELWTFDQRDKTKLEPKGDPVWVLSLSWDETPDGSNQLARLRRALSLPNSFKTRPVGLAADSPEQALRRLSEASKRASTADDDTKARLEAVETVFRGLGDDVFFDTEKLPKVMKMAAGRELESAEIESSSQRRATARVEETTIELLKKSDGWAVTGIE